MPKINQEEYEILKALDDKWEWIARDSRGDNGGNLFAYLEKPFKRDVGVWHYGRGVHHIDNHLFQFIQWENEEPYNIQKLVEEYEFGKILLAMAEEETVLEFERGSEETEVKKDKKWLVDKLTKERNEADVYDPRYQYLSEFIAYVSQLEEPEVLTSEWIDEKSFPIIHQAREKDVVSAKDLQEVLLPKQELPVIPQFVAEWVESNKQLEEKWNDYSKEDAMNDTIHFTIYGLFADYPATNSHVELRKPVLKWLSDDRGNYFKLVNAVRYGYELEEEEQKYYARIKGWKNITTGSEAFNWVYFKEKDTVGISKAVENKYQAVSFTKHDWDNLGINEHNADFVLVEELEEYGK